MSRKAESDDRAIRFAKEYLIDRNGTKAAIRAGYPPKGAHVAASRLLKTPKIKALIDKVVRKALSDVDLTAERIGQEIARLAFSDVRKLLRPDGTAIPINELDDDTAAAIAGFEIKILAGGSGNPADADDDEEFEKRKGDQTVLATQKIKMWDKGSALLLAARYRKMLSDEAPPPPQADPEAQRIKDFLYDMLRDQAKRAAAPAPAMKTIEHQPSPLAQAAAKPTNGSGNGHGSNGSGNGTKR